VALVYFGAAHAGLSLAFANKQVTAVWPPTGIALAALLVLGPGVWPGIALAAFAVNAMIGDSIAAAVAIAVGNAAGPMLAARQLRRSSAFARGLVNPRALLALIGWGAIGGMLITATNGVTVLALAGTVPWAAYFEVWWVWWVGDAMGVLVLAPLILAWVAPRGAGPRRWGELALALTAIALVAAAAFTMDVAEGVAPLNLQYAVFPFVIWISLRLGVAESALAALVVTVIAVWGAVHEAGPFATESLDARLIALETFVAIVSMTGLVLSLVAAERTSARAALQRSHDELEGRVAARTAELAATNAILARRSEEVEAFVYIVSHDLRVPLVNLQGFSRELDASCRELAGVIASLSPPPAPPASAALRRILDDDVAGALRYIRASATKFQRLIDALLVLSRTGKQELRLEVVDMRALVETTVQALRGSIDASGAEVEIAPLPPAVCDATAVGQVVANLLSNALKYLQPGRPGRISIGGEVCEGGTRYWVADNGAGIPDSARSRLFQVFQRFHPELAQGEGMGLAIVKRIVERHHGRVWAESPARDTRMGSVFSFTLRAAAEPERI
jgi:signal transduction histidine kinase